MRRTLWNWKHCSNSWVTFVTGRPVSWNSGRIYYKQHLNSIVLPRTYVFLFNCIHKLTCQYIFALVLKTLCMLEKNGGGKCQKSSFIIERLRRWISPFVGEKCFVMSYILIGFEIKILFSPFLILNLYASIEPLFGVLFIASFLNRHLLLVKKKKSLLPSPI